jgi:hypothetical protein
MESKPLKVSWIILLIPHIVVLIFGLIWALIPDIFLSSSFKPFMGQSWADFVMLLSSIYRAAILVLWQ